MPNWNENNLQVTGLSEEHEKQLEDAFQSGTPFQATVPRPTEEDGLPYWTTTLESTLRLWRGAPWFVALSLPEQEARIAEEKAKPNVLTDKQAAELTRKFGYIRGYDWCVGEWGTKWDASEIHYGEDAPGEFSAQFLTAWAPPEQWLEKLSALMPEATFTLTFSEEGYDFCGCLAARGGTLVCQDGTPPGNLLTEWEQQNHPELFAIKVKELDDGEAEDKLWELSNDVAGELIAKELERCLNLAEQELNTRLSRVGVPA